MNLKELSLFLTEDIYLIGEDKTIQIEASEKSTNQKTPEKKDHEPSNSQNLVEEPTAELGKNTDSESIMMSFEGDFKKGILIIYQGRDLSDDIREFLMKILGAVNCTLKDIALISEETLKSGIQDPIPLLNPKKMIVFGILHHPVMKLKKDNYFIVQEDLEYFFADDLSELAGNISLKKKLWSTLQLFFNINLKTK